MSTVRFGSLTLNGSGASHAVSDLPNLRLLGAILFRLELDAVFVADELTKTGLKRAPEAVRKVFDKVFVDKRTTTAFFDKNPKSKAQPRTYELICRYLQARLELKDVRVSLEPRMLRLSFPRAQLPEPLRQMLDDFAAHQEAEGTATATTPQPDTTHEASLTLPPRGVCVVYDTQDDTIDAFFAHLERHGPLVRGKKATFLVHSPHLFIPFVRRLFTKAGVASVKLFVGSPTEALRLESRRQAYLIDAKLRSEILTDCAHLLRDKRLELVRYNVPPPFEGYHIDGVVVCMGVYGWLPTFTDCNPDEETRLLKRNIEQQGIPIPNIGDRLTLNGHLMPHVQVFRAENDGSDSQYARLATKFDLQTRALEHYYNLNPKHKDFDLIDTPNPQGDSE